ncbi:MAG TPA: DsbA family protein [Methylomirabilota bacterium]
MDAVVWSDYICPWCYVGLDRTALLERRGVRVRPQPFELHPELPPEGVSLASIRPGGRTAALYERIEAECEELGLAFRRPLRIPRSRQALETAVVVEQQSPAAASQLHRLLFDAHFVEGLAIDDPAVLDDLMDRAGADPAAAREALLAGAAAGVLDRSRQAAYDAGATGTPSWLVDGRALIAGLQPRARYERVLDRLTPAG